MRKRKTALERIEAFFAVVPNDAPVLLGTLKAHLGTSYSSLKRLVQIIERIQNSPKLRVIYLKGNQIAVQLEEIKPKKLSEQPEEEI